ncbi:hypothetical protein AYI70_g11860 [Smittium culicis]|uniref:Uncharacterized protein n=1 Tax=Smittium culicis TaxID=133412 RepID=A0A1R1WZZ7_9FUNG|nr:hypothetical protein AYI70_g11860 [Smittium culicis]
MISLLFSSKVNKRSSTGSFSIEPAQLQISDISQLIANPIPTPKEANKIKHVDVSRSPLTKRSSIPDFDAVLPQAPRKQQLQISSSLSNKSSRISLGSSHAEISAPTANIKLKKIRSFSNNQTLPKQLPNLCQSLIQIKPKKSLPTILNTDNIKPKKSLPTTLNTDNIKPKKSLPTSINTDNIKPKKEFLGFSNKLFKASFFKKALFKPKSENPKKLSYNSDDDDDLQLNDFESSLLSLGSIDLQMHNSKNIPHDDSYLIKYNFDPLADEYSTQNLDKDSNSSNRSSTTLVDKYLQLNDSNLDLVRIVYSQSLNKLANNSNHTLLQKICIKSMIKSAEKCLYNNSPEPDVPEPSEIDIFLAERFYNNSACGKRNPSRNYRISKSRSSPQLT